MVKWTAGDDRLAASCLCYRACGQHFMFTSTSDIFHNWYVLGENKWCTNIWTLIILEMLVPIAGQEIDCEITFLLFTSHCRSVLYSNTVTMLFLESAVNNTKTLSTSLPADDFISCYKLFISLRSWKVILTWNKALLWSHSVIPRGGWLFVFMISWQQTPLLCSQ